jgi:hypothetical protein
MATVSIRENGGKSSGVPNGRNSEGNSRNSELGRNDRRWNGRITRRT